VGHIVNPSLVVSEEAQDGEEGCLSIPELYYPTPRAMHATAYGFDQHGEPLTVEGSGFLARALQHEAGHLDGQLFVDTLAGDTRRRALREIRAAKWSAPTR
jgi:peptide deformylase